MRRFWQSILFVVLTSALCLPTISTAQSTDFRQLTANRSGDNVVTIDSAGATGRTDVDSTITFAGDPATGSVVTAPNDDAILAVFDGANITVTDLIFRHTGSTRFGIYVAGGNVTIDGCRFEGPFDTAIYLGAGSLTLRNCTFDGNINGISAQQGASVFVEELILQNAVESGIIAQAAPLTIHGADFTNAGQNAVYIIGPAPLELSDAVFTGGGDIQLAVLNGASANVSDVGFDLNGGIAILAQDAGEMQVRHATIEGAGQLGLAVQGIQALDVSGMAIQFLGAPVQISDVAGRAKINGMFVDILGPEDYGPNIQNVGQLEFAQSEVHGGEVGLLLQGGFGAINISDNTFTGQTFYGMAIQDIYMDRIPPNADIQGNQVISVAQGVPISLQETRGFSIVGNSFLAEGDAGAILQNSEQTMFSQNTLVTAPEIPASPEYIVETENGPMIVSSGAPNPVHGRDFFDEARDNSDNTYLTAANLLRSDYLDTEGRHAVAGFWSGKTAPDYNALLFALEDAKADRAARAVERESWPMVSLSPPPDGYRWSSNAFVATFRDLQGNEITAYPSDFPVRLPLGQHAVDIDHRTVAVLDVAGDQSFEVPLANAPYFVWRDEDGPVRGATLHLRDTDILRAMLDGVRPMAIAEFSGNHEAFAKRAGVSLESGLEARQLAMNSLIDVRARIVETSEREDWPARQRWYLTMAQLLDFMVEFGKPEDVAFLANDLADAGVDSWYRSNATVRLEQRLGLLDGGVAQQKLAEQMRDDPTGLMAAELANALARTGDKGGIAAKVVIHQQKLDDPDSHDRIADALSMLNYVDADERLDLNRTYLQALRSDINAEIAQSDLSEAWGLISKYAWTNAGTALANVAVYGDEADQSLLALPVPLRADFARLMEYAASPSDVFSAYMGFEGLDVDGRSNNWHRTFGELACPALTYRTALEKELALESMRFTLRQATIRDHIPDYYTLSVNQRQGYRYWFDLRMDLSLSHCYANGAVPEIDRSESALAEEERKFLQENASYDPDWWVRPERAAIKIAALKEMEDWPDVSGFSPYSPDYIAGLMGDGGNLDPLFVKVFLMHQRLMTAANQSPQNFYSFGAERRLFKIRSNGGDSVISSYGIVDVRPRLLNGKLQIAIRPNIIAGDYEGGLAGMITAPTYEPYNTPDRIRMFESVAVERGGETLPLTYVETLRGGVHLYEIPWEHQDFAESYLRIGMRYVDERWPLDIPLYSSQLAFQQRLQSTEFAVPEVTP